MLGTSFIFLMNASEANECVAPQSISTYVRVLEIDSSPNITEVSFHIHLGECEYSEQSLMKCPSLPYLKHILVLARHFPG